MFGTFPSYREMREEAQQMAEAGRIAARAERRDCFAMAAMTGLCADSGTAGFTVDAIARTAYALADAMEAEREKGLAK